MCPVTFSERNQIVTSGRGVALILSSLIGVGLLTAVPAARAQSPLSAQVVKERLKGPFTLNYSLTLHDLQDGTAKEAGWANFCQEYEKLVAAGKLPRTQWERMREQAEPQLRLRQPDSTIEVTVSSQGDRVLYESVEQQQPNPNVNPGLRQKYPYLFGDKAETIEKHTVLYDGKRTYSIDHRANMVWVWPGLHLANMRYLPALSANLPGIDLFKTPGTVALPSPPAGGPGSAATPTPPPPALLVTHPLVNSRSAAQAVYIPGAVTGSMVQGKPRVNDLTIGSDGYPIEKTHFEQHQLLQNSWVPARYDSTFFDAGKDGKPQARVGVNGSLVSYVPHALEGGRFDVESYLKKGMLLQRGTERAGRYVAGGGSLDAQLDRIAVGNSLRERQAARTETQPIKRSGLILVALSSVVFLGWLFLVWRQRQASAALPS